MRILYNAYIGNVDTIHDTLYNGYRILFDVQCTPCHVHCTLYTVRRTIYTVYCTLYAVQYTLYAVQYTLYSVHTS